VVAIWGVLMVGAAAGAVGVPVMAGGVRQEGPLVLSVFRRLLDSAAAAA